MKKLLFSAYSLDLGGIETALITLLNKLIETNDVTLVLEKKQGMFLNEINSKVKIIEYRPNESKIVIFRKIINLLKRIQFSIKYKNKYDFAASFATYSKAGSFVARTASKNTALWVHINYLTFFNQDIWKMNEFFNELHVDKFSHIVFVSKEAKDVFIKGFPQLEKKCIVCNNLINYQKILEKAEEEIEMKKEPIYTFLNIGRHDEKQKKLTRIIQVAKRLKDEGYSFRVLFIGKGEDTPLYQRQIKQEGLEDVILLLGSKANPYPYFKIADSVILTSDYEGYPVVFVESFILNKPIITTDISDAKEEVEGKFGIVTTTNIDTIYEAMKSIIASPYEIKEKFDPEKFNENILDKLEKMFCRSKS